MEDERGSQVIGKGGKVQSHLVGGQKKTIKEPGETKMLLERRHEEADGDIQLHKCNNRNASSENAYMCDFWNDVKGKFEGKQFCHLGMRAC